MAKVNAPMLGFSAGGQIGKALVFSKWRGIAYGRQYVIPGNPRSTAQMATRNPFSWLNNVYKLVPAQVSTVWTAQAQGRPLTNRNAFIKANLSHLIDETTLANFTFANGARGGLPAATVVATGGALSISVAITPPDPPVGWTLQKSIAAAILDQNPATGTDYASFAAEASSTPWTVSITGLEAASDYIVGAWLQWLKPDGSLAYSAATMTTATTS